jgi:transcriptional regulator with XRE-family HTH domain
MEQTSPEAQLGATIKRARHRAKVSLRSMAVALGTDHSEVARIERGRASTLTRYAKIAGLLGLDLVVRLKKRSA